VTLSPLLAATLRNPFVWLGTAGSAAIGWGATNSEFSFSSDGWGATVAGVGATVPMPLDRILIVVGVVALTAAWWFVRPTKTRPPVHMTTTLVLWCLPLLLVPPVLSPDATLYADAGWALNHGLNPYITGLGTSGSPYAAQVDSLWAGSGVAYPPLTLEIERFVVAMTGAHPYWGFVAMRVPNVVSVAVMMAVLPRLAPLVGVPRRSAVWLGVLNPLLVVHIVGGAHNDGPMIAATLVAIWLAARWPRAWMSLLVAPVVVGIAMGLKQQGGLAVVAVAGLPVAAQLAASPPVRRVVTLAWRTAVAGVVAVGAFAGICVGTGLGFGWANWLDLMGKANTPAPLALASKGLALLVSLGGGDATAFLHAAGLVSTGILIAVLAWCFLHFADRPLAIVAWGALAVAVLGEALHPWYVPWGLALAGLIPLTRKQRRWVWGVAIAFVVWNAFQTVIWHGQQPW